MQDLHNIVEKLSQLKDMEAERRGVVVVLIAQLHSTKPNSVSAQSQILLMMCRRFPMVRISDSGSDWK